MQLNAMRYKDFVWPHNPRTYVIEYEREMAANKVPFGHYHLQDLGPARRIMRGEGEFVGPDAYDRFKALASVFYQKGPGMLIHPVWQCANAYFVELSLRQEPRRDYVRYTFAFWECYDGYETELREESPEPARPGGGGGGAPEQVWHTVRRGECLWRIARDRGISLSEIIRLNPQIKNPNLILPGEKVRVR